MGERNDLIERRWIGVVPSGLQGPAKVTRLERVAEIWRNQGLFVTEWVPATTIASLSEALAEAEKKGAEDWQPIETAPRDGTRIILLRRTGPVFGCWDDDRYNTKPRPYWTHDQIRAFGNADARKMPPTHWRPLPAPPRDLSQGGQP